MQASNGTRFSDSQFSAYDESLESKNLPSLLICFGDLLNCINELNLNIHPCQLLFIGCLLAGGLCSRPQEDAVTAEQQPPRWASPAFLLWMTIAKPEQRAGLARTLSLYDASPLWPTCCFGQEVMNSPKVFLARDYSPTQVRSLGLNLGVCRASLSAPCPQILHKILTLWVREVEVCSQ